jgi:hypothetical protein
MAGHLGAAFAAPSHFGTWVGARVASPQRSILRSGATSLCRSSERMSVGRTGDGSRGPTGQPGGAFPSRVVCSRKGTGYRYEEPYDVRASRTDL